MKIKTLEDAAAFVRKVKICTVFPSGKTELTSLYENVDLPEKQPGESGWGQRVEAVWPWKNQLPTDWPSGSSKKSAWNPGRPPNFARK